jgi:hypothetical protein
MFMPDNNMREQTGAHLMSLYKFARPSAVGLKPAIF